MRLRWTIHSFPRMSAQPRQQGINGAEEVVAGRFGWKSQDGDPGVVFRPEHQRVAEVQVKGDETAAFLAAGCDERGVGCLTYLLSRHRGNIVPRSAGQLRAALPQVFVELEFQEPRSVEMSTKRSRDISAP